MGGDVERLQNLIGGAWVESAAADRLDVANPASGRSIATVPLSSGDEVAAAVAAASDAFPDWRGTPAIERARLLFRLHQLIQIHFEDLSRTITEENGKTLDEARGELLRTLENVEVAAGIPSLQSGDFSTDISRGIDEASIREPLGVFAQIGPFNFPSMVPWWFAPYAVACGNTYVIKPSPQTPLSQTRLMELVIEAGFPPGVFNLIHGGREQSEALATNPQVAGISFVGSSPVARHVYETATRAGKRAQCQGGAKNHLVVMPDAELDPALPNISGSTFGCAGQRCLAGSAVVAVGDVHDELRDRLVATAAAITVGNGLDPASGMGPVISAEARQRILDHIDQALAEGAELLIDGREVEVEDHPDGFWVGPTILGGVTPDMAIARDEIFGPVINLMRADTLDDAIDAIEANPFGNAASIYTNSGGAARRFTQRANIGNIGVNVGVAAPMAFFPFAGRKESFFGDVHAQGHEVVRFFTDPKIVITRWPGHTDGRDPWD